MINAFGNYIGFGNPQFPPLKTNGFVTQTNLTDDIGLLTIYYDANNPNPLNGTGSFEFNSEKEVEYLIVGAGGYGGYTYLNGQPQSDLAGAGGGGGGVVSGSMIIEADKTYTAVCGNSVNFLTAPVRKGADSYIIAHDGENPIAYGGGAGGWVDAYSGLDVSTSGSNGGSGGGGGVGDQFLTFDETPGYGTKGIGQYIFGSNGASGSLYGSSYGTKNAEVWSRDYASLILQNRVANSYLSGSYVQVWLPSGGGGATQNGAQGVVNEFNLVSGSDSINYFEVTGSMNGGNGVISNITNTPTYYGGGGGGTTYQISNDISVPYATASWSVGNGGLGGGGAAGVTGSNGLGGGGGTASSGGSGIIYIRYALNQRNLVR